MNLIKPKLARSQRHGSNRPGSNRHGLSVIEVLTSIVVALIGVFGVMAMIPFSVKQTQSGLDQDAATSMARNAVANFEATGFKVASDNPAGGPGKLLNWINPAGMNVTNATAGSTLLCIDPLGVTENQQFGTFPFHSDSPVTFNSIVPALPEVDAAGNPIPFNLGDPKHLAQARRMFRLTDDLVFAESDDPSVTDSDLLGPQQIFNEGPAGLLNRQSNGTVSWCAIAHPIINNAAAATFDSYKFYVLVFKDRVTDPTVEESEMASALVTAPLATVGTGDIYAQPLSNITIDQVLNENVRRNDWVMLINVAPLPAGAPEAARTNIAFARITNLDSGDSDARLSLDGPNFNFPVGAATTIVHLRDVVAVFPRTIKLETTSGWTVTAD